MPKMKNVTAFDLKELDSLGSQLTHLLLDANDRVEKGYCDEIANPAELARSFLSLSAAATRTAQLFLVRHALSEQQREIEMLRSKT